MAASVNKVILIGNVGQPAELRYTPSGAAVTGFSIATTENWTSKDGEKHEATEWHRIVLWNKMAETLTPYLTKGKQVYVEGSLTTRKWEKDGQKHYTTEIKAHRLNLLGGGYRNDPAPDQTTPGTEESPYDPPATETGDTIPF
jgi:single-strand DNA-binding protein